MAVFDVELALEFQQKDARLNGISVCRAELHEQISRPFCCHVTFLSQENLPLDLLTSLLQSGVRLTISQLIGGLKIRQREVRGMVSSYNFLGIFFAGSRNEHKRFAFELVLEPKMVLAQYNRKIRTYSSRSAPDLIKEILSEYDSEPVYDNNLIQTDRFNNKQIFNQQQQSDFDFIHNLMCLYGLNYCFDHDDTGDKPFDPRLYFASSWQMLPKKPDRLVESRLSQVNPGLDILLDDIKMAGSLGSGVRSRYFNRSDDTENRIFELYNAVSHARGNGYSADAFNRSLIQYALTSALKNCAAVVSGSSTDARVRPGLQFTLPAEIKSGCICLTKSIDLTALAPAAKGYSLFAGGKRGLQIDFTALMTDDKSEPGCLLIEKPADLDKIFPQNYKIISGVVCSADGKVSRLNQSGTATAVVTVPGEADMQRPDLIFVRLNDGGSVILCELTLPGGSADDGWCRYPKLGDPVLVGMNCGRFYLHGFAPSALSLPSSHEDKRLEQLRSSTWRHQAVNSKAVNAAGSLDAGTTEISHQRFKEAENYVQYAVYKGQLDSLVRLCCARQNSSDLWDDYEEKYQADAKALEQQYNQLYEDLIDLEQQREEACVSFGSSQADEVPDETKLADKLSSLDSSIKEKQDKLTAAAAEINTLAANVSKLLSLGGSYAKASLNLNSGGNIQLSAENGIISENCAEHNLAASGAVTVTADGEVTINSNSKITLAVGPNTIILNQNEIIIESLKYASGGGPFDTYIKMDSISGIEMNAMAIGMEGVWSVIMGDNFGGSVELINGAAAVKGHSLDLSTNSKEDLIGNLAKFGTTLTTELATINADSEQGDAAAYGVGVGLEISECLPELVHEISKNYKSSKLEVVNAILAAIITLTDLTVEAYLAAGQEEALLKKVNGSKMSQGDLIKILSLIFKTGLMTTTMAAAIAEARFAYSSQLTLSTKEIEFISKEIELAAVNVDEKAVPTAGL